MDIAAWTAETDVFRSFAIAPTATCIIVESRTTMNMARHTAISGAHSLRPEDSYVELSVVIDPGIHTVVPPMHGPGRSSQTRLSHTFTTSGNPPTIDAVSGHAFFSSPAPRCP
jgi:hypothetical protein